MIKKAMQYMTDDVWRIRTRDLGFKQSLPIRALRVLVLSFREFGKDQCYLRASALTFYSLLSIVPVFAMAFGIAKGFGVEKMLEKRLLESMEGQEEVLSRVIEFSQTMLNNTRGGLIAGIGILLLFWTVIRVLGNIEISFNHIWGVKSQRTFGRRIGDYLVLMLVCPIFFILSGSLTVFVASQIEVITQKVSLLGFLGPILFFFLKFTPYLVSAALLTFLYSFMPNTKIPLSSAMLGGLIGGTVYQIVQWAYINFQIGVSNYGAIYGSFAALPLFLIWLQMSWLIVLYGAEVAFAHHHEETYEFEKDCLQISHSFRQLLSLRIMKLCVDQYDEEQPALDADTIASKLEVPIRLTRDLLSDLHTANLLAVVQDETDKNERYIPNKPIDHLTVQRVLKTLESYGEDKLPIMKDEEFERLQSCLKAFDEAVLRFEKDVALRDLSLVDMPSPKEQEKPSF